MLSMGSFSESEQSGLLENEIQNESSSVAEVQSNNSSEPETAIRTVNDPADQLVHRYNQTQYEEAKLQSIVFLEDALQYRSIHHKTSTDALKLYRWYHSAPVQYCIKTTIYLILLLAFFEYPSSLSVSSDPRKNCDRFVQYTFNFFENLQV